MLTITKILIDAMQKGDKTRKKAVEDESFIHIIHALTRVEVVDSSVSIQPVCNFMCEAVSIYFCQSIKTTGINCF